MGTAGPVPLNVKLTNRLQHTPKLIKHRDLRPLLPYSFTAWYLGPGTSLLELNYTVLCVCVSFRIVRVFCRIKTLKVGKEEKRSIQRNKARKKLKKKKEG
jgi:hypothetical protein